MNDGTPQEIEKRKADRRRMETLVDEIQKAEAGMIKDAKSATGEVIESQFAMVKSCAVESGHMVMKVNIEVSFNFSEKSIEVRYAMQPPPVLVMKRKGGRG